MIAFRKAGLVLILATLYLPRHTVAAESTFDIDVKELERKESAPKGWAKGKKKVAPKKVEKPVPHQAVREETRAASDEYVRYKVQEGDFRLKALAKHLNLPEPDAETLLPEILSLNDLSGLSDLLLGQTLLLPHSVLEKMKPIPPAIRRVLREKRGLKPTTPGIEYLRYKVQEGDFRKRVLARHLKVTEKDLELYLPQILEANDLGSLDDLLLGQTLLVPQEMVKTPAAPPAPATPVAPESAAPEVPAPPAAPAPAEKAPAPEAAAPPATSEFTPVCCITGKDTHSILDSFLTALNLRWMKSHIIESGKGARKAFSVRVDRYFELNGEKYVITVGDMDPYSYTLLRVLGRSGYHVLQLRNGDDFRTVGERVLGFVGLAPRFESRTVKGSSQTVTGFYLTREMRKGTLIITDASPAAEMEGVQITGCGIR